MSDITYKKAVDPDLKAIALIFATEAVSYVLTRNSAKDSITIQAVQKGEQVFVGGQIMEIEGKEYDEILFNQWNFTGISAFVQVGIDPAESEVPEQPTDDSNASEPVGEEAPEITEPTPSKDQDDEPVDAGNGEGIVPDAPADDAQGGDDVPGTDDPVTENEPVSDAETNPVNSDADGDGVDDELHDRI